MTLYSRMKAHFSSLCSLASYSCYFPGIVSVPIATVKHLVLTKAQTFRSIFIFHTKDLLYCDTDTLLWGFAGN